MPHYKMSLTHPSYQGGSLFTGTPRKRIYLDRLEPGKRHVNAGLFNGSMSSVYHHCCFEDELPGWEKLMLNFVNTEPLEMYYGWVEFDDYHSRERRRIGFSIDPLSYPTNLA